MDDNRIYETNTRLNRLQSNSFFAAAGLAFIFCVSFSLSGVSSKSSAQAIKLESRINPNNASEASLMRLPGVGLSRANAIVEYRRQFRHNNQDALAFQDCNDLDKVKGIGPATVSDLCQWLKFE